MEWKPPAPPPDTSESLAEFYRNAMLDISVKLSTDDVGSLPYEKRQALLREIAAILNELDANARAWVEEFVPQALAHGEATALVTIGKAATLAEAVDIVSTLGMVDREAVEYIVSDTMSDLLAANEKTAREIQRFVRERVAEHTRSAKLRSDKASNAGRKIAADLSKVNAAIVDRAGKRWQNDVYAQTVAKTKIAEATREGAVNRAVVEGYDVALISAHGAKDSCRFHENTLVSLTGKTPGLPTLAQLKQSRTIFHPRCSHRVLPCNPAMLPESVRKAAEEKAAGAAEALRLAAEGKLNSHGLKKGA